MVVVVVISDEVCDENDVSQGRSSHESTHKVYERTVGIS